MGGAAGEEAGRGAFCLTVLGGLLAFGVLVVGGVFGGLVALRGTLEVPRLRVAFGGTVAGSFLGYCGWWLLG